MTLLLFQSAPAFPKTSALFLLQDWRDLMSLLSSKSCDVYRGIVYRTPEFYDYFMQSTAARYGTRL